MTQNANVEHERRTGRVTTTGTPRTDDADSADRLIRLARWVRRYATHTNTLEQR